MYTVLLTIHSVFRWLVLMSLLYALYRAYRGYSSQAVFTPTDNAVRHWTATIAHVQLLLGIVLYTQSPLMRYFWRDLSATIYQTNMAFFGLVHLVLMLTAIIVVTLGSAFAKRKALDREKFRTMLVWFSVALFIILVAIPWPFSPLAQRPYVRL